MADLLAKLEEEYCPPLDPALLSAILSDFVLTNKSHIQEARNILETLKEAAPEEELGFDASGTGAQDGGFSDEAQLQSSTEASDLRSRETDMTSLSNGISSLGLEARSNGPNASEASTGDYEDIESMDEDKKVDLLLQVIQNDFTRTRALHTLRKCKGNWHRAMEEMLTHVYFEDAEHSDDGSKILAKGIDAFSEDNVVKRGRKGKAKKRHLQNLDHRRSSSLPLSPVDSPAPPTNRWKTSNDDIEFLATRMNMSTKTISSIFYSNGASVPRTISAILKKSLQNDAPSEDPIIAVNAHDLCIDFPSISLDYATTLARVTHPSTAAAHEIAKALTARPAAPGGIQIIPQYAAPSLESDDSPWMTVSKPVRRPQTPDSSIGTSDVASQARSYAAARSAALAQAYAAHRKSRSDRLMGGAAAYYGEVYRDITAQQSKATALAADQHAASQSSAHQLDLHGVDVLNGVRIALERVEQWWDGLGEHRANGRIGAVERQAGFTIVVGRGIHSEGGKSKLGPAVSKMLKNEGWKYEQGGASIVVKGRVRS